MNIGIVTTWFERGAAYVSKTYMQLLENEGHNIYIFARGGEDHPSKKEKEWNLENVTRSEFYYGLKIHNRDIVRWIKKNNIQSILFNEQSDFQILIFLKKKFPEITLGAYVDYYTENTLKYFNFYDFVICNTKRHMQAMNFHQQKFYVPWGTDINLYAPKKVVNGELTFFHSVGMSNRKGTDILVDAFISGKCYKKSKLVIHTQIPIEKVCKYNKAELKTFNIEVIEKTVTAPGLYFMGDVYVYPTRLDGLGLTMYEALSSGLPLITTDFPPMNEVGDETCVKRVKVKDFYCRGDAYYFPMSICDEQSLIEALNYYIDNKTHLSEYKENARMFAVKNYDIYKQSKNISSIFKNAEPHPLDLNLERQYKKYCFDTFSIIKWLSEFKWVRNILKV